MSYFCDYCDNIGHPDDIYDCDNCKNNYHETCLKPIAKNGGWLCEECGKK